jgi:hypothetical protein
VAGEISLLSRKASETVATLTFARAAMSFILTCSGIGHAGAVGSTFQQFKRRPTFLSGADTLPFARQPSVQPARLIRPRIQPHRPAHP